MEKTFKVVLVDYDSDLFDLASAVKSSMEQILSAVGANLAVGQFRSEEAVSRAAASADLVLIQTVRPLLNSRVIPTLPYCRGIIRLGLGYDSVDVPAATQAGILVSNVTNWCNAEVAEHALALLMAGARKVTQMNHVLHSGNWARVEAAPIFRLAGKTIGLVGFGRIAQEVAARLQGFGMNLLGYDPYQDAANMNQWGVKKTGLDELLAQSDFISVHARLTDETFHLLGAREFALVKPGAFLINTSRGGIIDEPELEKALQQGRLRGVALDVMEREPLPQESALRRMPNVILTPHIASYSVEAGQELYLRGAQIAAQILEGRWVDTIVNPQVRPLAESRWGRYH